MTKLVLNQMKKGFLNAILLAFIAVPIRVIPTATPTSLQLVPLRQIQITSVPTVPSTAAPQRKLEKAVVKNTPTTKQTLRIIPTAVRLSPTPTPTAAPIRTRKTIEFKSKENIFLFDGKEDESTGSSIMITMASSSAVFTKDKDFTRLSFEIDDKKIDIPVRSDFIIKDNKFFLLDNGRELPLKFSPLSFYVATRKVLEKTKGELKTIELMTKDNKPIYNLRIKNKLKLLGIIPYDLETRLWVNGETNTIEKTYTSILSYIASKIDWAEAYAVGANVKLRNVQVSPISYRSGNKLTIVGQIYNDGTDDVSGYWNPDKPNRIILQNSGNTIDQNTGAYILAPGEWHGFVLNFDNLVCDAPLTVWFDPDNYIKETDKKDNTWQTSTKCAPNNGPDLVVTSITYPDNYQYKIIGKKNKVNYTIKNIGDQNSIIVQGLARQGNANFASLISVPVTKPGFNFTGSFNYTPTSCEPLQIEIDGQKWMKDIETNRDNNIGYDTAQTDVCNNFPDLTPGGIYWTVDNYSYGKSHYPNGSLMKFDIHVKNRNLNKCAGGIYLGIYENDTLLQKPYFGSISCPGDGTATLYEGDNIYVGDKNIHLNYMPNCNSTFTIKIDPDGNSLETNIENNSWSTKIVCE